MSAQRASEAAPRTLEEVLDWFQRNGSQEIVQGMSRYGIPNNRAFGMAMRDLKAIAKRIGSDHDLALALWESGWYEARCLAAFVAEPEHLTALQMDQWASAFDSWAICDTVCFHLFDRSSHAWPKVDEWSESSCEYVKRAAFALIWALSVHDKSATDDRFQKALNCIDRCADDERTYVKKAIDMALRATGKRNPVLHQAALVTAGSLAESPEGPRRWIGNRALKELQSDRVRSKMQ